MKKKALSTLAWFTGISLILVGVAHFLFPFKFGKLVPPYLPFPVILGLLSGWIEIFLGAGILYKPTRQLCALGYIVLLIAVFPANIHMVADAASFGVSPAVAWGRLPFQLLFFTSAWVLWKEPILA